MNTIKIATTNLEYGQSGEHFETVGINIPINFPHLKINLVRIK